MSRTYIKLAGTAERYNYQGQVYEKGKIYGVPTDRANVLSRKEDEYGRRYFATLSDAEVQVLTGEQTQKPKKVAPKKPVEAKPVIEETDETSAEKQAKLKQVAAHKEAEDLAKEPMITDSDIEVIGLRQSAIEGLDDEDAIEV